MMDENENLLSFSKQDIRRFAISAHKSQMPGYEKVFTSSELDDLVAYLYSLQRKTRLQ
jgi:hypothetical protein